MPSTGGPDPLEHLPLQLTSFVGREHELRELTGLLERSRPGQRVPDLEVTRDGRATRLYDLLRHGSADNDDRTLATADAG